MRRFFVLPLLAVTAAAILPASRAWADLDPIPPTVLGFGQTLDLVFPNHVHPQPSRKVLQFTGFAQASGTPGVAALLGIHFDYVDATGATIIVPLPNFYQEAIQPGGPPIPINAGPTVLPYCPPIVSIHFENLTPGTEIEFSGMYDHTCVIIPEPGTATLLGLGLCMVLARRRK